VNLCAVRHTDIPHTMWHIILAVCLFYDNQFCIFKIEVSVRVILWDDSSSVNNVLAYKGVCKSFWTSPLE